MTWTKQAIGRESACQDAIRALALSNIRNEARVDDEQLLLAVESLTRMEDLLRAQREILVVMLRDRKVTWDEIGLFLGVSRSAAQQRYGRVVSEYLDTKARERLVQIWNG